VVWSCAQDRPAHDVVPRLLIVQITLRIRYSTLRAQPGYPAHGGADPPSTPRWCHLAPLYQRRKSA